MFSIFLGILLAFSFGISPAVLPALSKIISSAMPLVINSVWTRGLLSSLISLEISFAISLSMPFGISRNFIWEIFENSSRNSYNCSVIAFSHLNQNSFDSLVTNSSVILLGIPAIFSLGKSSPYTLKNFRAITEKLLWLLLQEFLRLLFLKFHP